MLLRNALFAAFLSLPVAATAADILPEQGTDALTREYQTYKPLALSLLRGEKIADPNDKTHADALDFHAKYSTYRFTWPKEQTERNGIERLFQSIESDLKLLNDGSPGTKTAATIYYKQMTVHALEVLQTQKVISRVNGARVLERLARTGPPDMIDTLIEVLKDPNQIDAVKLYMIKGLGAQLGQAGVLTPPSEKKVVEALIEFIERKSRLPDPPAAPAVDSLKAERDALRYIRREAIKALAGTRGPSAGDKGRPALVFLRLIARDGFNPPPRIDEQVEAFIGLAQLKPSLDKEYQPDYAIQQMALFMEPFIRESQIDLRDDTPTKPAKHFAWKFLASRMIEAAQKMQAEVDTSYGNKVLPGCIKALKQIELGAGADSDAIVQYVLANPPPVDRLIRGMADSTVKPANRRE
jgi:hypothetical protein